MIPANFRVLLDANVLYPNILRDTLLRCAEAGLYQLLWSAEILEEVRRNLVANGAVTEEKAAGLIRVMTQAFPEAEVTDYEHLTPAMPNDEKDRHVAAAALVGGAQVIVTNNLKDFRKLPSARMQAKRADEFLCDLFDLDPEGVVLALENQVAALKTPPVPLPSLLKALGSQVPDFSQVVREFLGE